MPAVPAVQGDATVTQITVGDGLAQFDGPVTSLGPLAPEQPSRLAALGFPLFAFW